MLLCLHAMARQPWLVIFCGYVVPDRPFCNRPAHWDDPDHLQIIVTPHRSVLHQHNKGRWSIQFANKNVSYCQTVLFATGRPIWMIQIICKKNTPMGHFLNRRSISISFRKAVSEFWYLDCCTENWYILLLGL